MFQRLLYCLGGLGFFFFLFLGWFFNAFVGIFAGVWGFFAGYFRVCNLVF